MARLSEDARHILSLTRINLPPVRSCTRGSDLRLLLLPPTSNASTQKERRVDVVESPPEAVPAVSAIHTVSEDTGLPPSPQHRVTGL